MIDRSLRVVVLANPFGRLVRFLPPLTATFEDLAARGYFKKVLNDWSMTDKGRVAHWLACEINPRRASYRTLKSMAEAFRWRVEDGRAVETVKKTKRLIDEIVNDGLAEVDPDYTRDTAWRLLR